MGTGVSLQVLDGCLVLLPDIRKETWLRQQQKHLGQQKMVIEKARWKALTLMVQASG
ncbi:hypothetical protein [Erwinia sp. E_sp_W01_1]|uniref:hypothetical protein n=1 Tax=Erwinia sp. E_sp_W01_1 TaxID=3039407 RepID=UPI0030D3ACE5